MYVHINHFFLKIEVSLRHCCEKTSASLVRIGGHKNESNDNLTHVTHNVKN